MVSDVGQYCWVTTFWTFVQNWESLVNRCGHCWYWGNYRSWGSHGGSRGRLWNFFRYNRLWYCWNSLRKRQRFDYFWVR